MQYWKRSHVDKAEVALTFHLKKPDNRFTCKKQNIITFSKIHWTSIRIRRGFLFSSRLFAQCTAFTVAKLEFDVDN